MKDQHYLAVVTGALNYTEIPNKEGPGKIKVNMGSLENFRLFAKDDTTALIEARKQIYAKGIKERRFKGVVRLKN